MEFSKRLKSCYVLILLLLVTSNCGVFADVILDGSMGTYSGTLTENGTEFFIPDRNGAGTVGTEDGNNLFHSFSEFDLTSDQTATFVNTSATTVFENIIARVINDDPSSINGLLVVDPGTLPGANLFLMNSSGIIFGSSAIVSVTGSFHLTTADYLTLGDDSGVFTADGVDTELSDAGPSAFGFTDSTPAGITINGNPVLPIASPNGMVSIVGGNIEINNDLSPVPVQTVVGARVNIVSVGDPVVGFVPSLVMLGENDVNVSNFQSLGNIRIDENAVIGTADLGEIYIRGGNFILDAGAKVVSVTESAPGNGLIDVEITGDITIDNGATIASTISSSGNGASISVSGTNLTLARGGQITSATTGLFGTGGDIAVDITGGDILIDGYKVDPQTEQDFSGIYSLTEGVGSSAGNIQIDSAILSMLNGGTITNMSLGSGDGGNVTIDTTTSLTLSGIYEDLPGSIIPGVGSIDKPTSIVVGSAGIGRSGQLLIVDTPLLTLNLLSEIQGLTINSGTGNTMQINAEEFNIDTGSKLASYTSGGNPGNSIGISSTTLNIDNGGQILSATTTSGDGGSITISSTSILLDSTSPMIDESGYIISSASDSGTGGAIAISGTDLTLNNGGQITSLTTGSGFGGNIAVDISGGDILIDGYKPSPQNEFDFSGIYEITNGTGRTGNIDVDCNNLAVSRGGNIFSFSGPGMYGKAGDIDIDVFTKLTLKDYYNNIPSSVIPDTSGMKDDKHSYIGSVSVGTGDSGNVDIFVPTLELSNAGHIINSVFNGGNAGSITLNSTDITFDSQSEIDTVSGGIGTTSNVTVNADTFVLTGSGEIDARNYGSGVGGDIVVNVRKVELYGGSHFVTSTFSSGDAGDIIITASELVKLYGYDGDSNTELDARNESGDGIGGKINIISPTVLFDNLAGIKNGSWHGSGKTGDVSIYADEITFNNGGFIHMVMDRATGQGGATYLEADTITFTGVNPAQNNAFDYVMSGIYSIVVNDDSGANAGDITLNCRILNLIDGAGIVGSTPAQSAAADIYIDASEAINMYGYTDLPDTWNYPAFDISSTINSATIDRGRGGDIRINSPVLNMDDNAAIFVVTGAFDKYTLVHAPWITIGSGINEGMPGNIFINVGDLNLLNGSVISAQLGGFANSILDGNTSGQIDITATGTIKISGVDPSITKPDYLAVNGISASSSAGAYGGDGTTTVAAGDITIKASELILEDGMVIETFTTGYGNAGTMNIEVDNGITLSGAGTVIDSSTLGNANANNITILSNFLSILNGAEITSSTSGAGNGGDKIDIQLDALTIDGIGSRISNSASSSGDAGSVEIDTTSVVLSNSGGINTSTTAAGNAGQVNIDTSTISLSSNSTINSSTTGSGNANNVVIKGTSLLVQGGAEITSSTSGSGDGGMLIDIQSDSVMITGNGSKISNSATSSGHAGSIEIISTDLNLDDGGEINASTTASGNAGIVKITTTDIKLDNNSKINSSTSGIGNAGNITIKSDDLEITGNSEITSSTAGSGDGGEKIEIESDSVIIFGNGSRISNSASDAGSAGSIVIKSSDIEIKNGGEINVSTISAGNAGSVSIDSTDLEMKGGTISSSTTSSGNANYVDIKTVNFTVADSSGINASTTASGNAGTVTITTEEISITNNSSINSSTAGDGTAGNITIISDNLDVLTNSEITSSTSGAGDGGQMIDIKSDTITISGNGSRLSNSASDAGSAGSIAIKGTEVKIEDGGTINVSTSSSGSAGSVSIESTDFDMNNGTITSSTSSSGNANSIDIKSSTFDVIEGSEIIAESSGSGNGGNITTNSGTFLLSNGSRISAEGTGSGDGGNITIVSTLFNMKSQSEISATSFGSGKAGTIDITAHDRITIEDSSIITKADNLIDDIQNDGGNINITTTYMLKLVNSLISGEVTGGKGDGGNIFIDPIYVVLMNSNIIANAYGGAGGNITIISQMFLNDVTSLISASSELGIDGEIEITAPSIDISGSMAALPEGMAEISGLLPKKCSSRKDTDKSSFEINSGNQRPSSPDFLMMTP